MILGRTIITLAIIFSCWFRLFAHQDKTVVNQVWEYVLTSNSNLEHPYKNTIIKVIYNGSNGEQSEGYGFWDGGNDFRIRYAFPTQGVWTWKCISNDSSLQKTGVVDVYAYKGNNSLYSNGFLSVSKKGRFLEHANGKPFFWLACTAWRAPFNASLKEWEYYIKQRRGKGFSVVQIYFKPSDQRSERSGLLMFKNNELYKEWNPLFWQKLDKMVEIANQNEMVVVMCGMAEPEKHSYFAEEEEMESFFRNCTSRYCGNFVIYSPSADTWKNEHQQSLNRAGYLLKKYVGRQLITQHWGTSLAAPLKYCNEGYIDFASVQTGHNKGDTILCIKQASEWVQEIYKSCSKPVLNIEGLYVNAVFNDKEVGSAVLNRNIAYLSMLNGSFGFSYGINNLWQWNKEWKKALHHNSSNDMAILRNIFEKVRWYDLKPQRNLLFNETKTQAFAITEETDLFMGYIFNSSELEVDLSSCRGQYLVRFINPKSGKVVSKTTYQLAKSKQEKTVFNSPSYGEWLIVGNKISF